MIAGLDQVPCGAVGVPDGIRSRDLRKRHRTLRELSFARASSYACFDNPLQPDHARLSPERPPRRGRGFILVAPRGLVVGSIASGALSEQGRLTVDIPPRSGGSPERARHKAARPSWKDMRLYARFPQGLPAGPGRPQLRPRPIVKPRGDSIHVH